MINKKDSFGKILIFNKNRKFYCIRVKNKIYLTTENGSCCLFTFCNFIDNQEHMALVFNGADKEKAPLVEVYSECIASNIFKSTQCNCATHLDESMKWFSKNSGIILYLRRKSEEIGLCNKIRGCKSQKRFILNCSEDSEDYTATAQMLYAMSIQRLRLASNDADQAKKLQDLGMSVVVRISTNAYSENKKPVFNTWKIVKREFALVKNVGEYLAGRNHS